MKVSATDERSVVRLASRSQLKILAFSSANMWSGNNVEVRDCGMYHYLWLFVN